MKFLVDESVEYRLVKFLRRKGYKVISIAEILPGAKDKEVLNLALKEKCVLITNDKDFGELAIKLLPKTQGIILFRMESAPYSKKEKAISLLIEKFSEKLQNSLIIVSENKIRIRRLN